jgi:hypothetical protein
MDYDQTAMGLPPVMSAVFLIRKADDVENYIVVFAASPAWVKIIVYNSL